MPAAAHIQCSQENHNGEKGKRAAGPSHAVPAAVAASCGVELRHPSCEGITRNVSTGICFPDLLLEERWGSSSLCCSNSPKRLRRGPWPRRGFLWDISCAPLFMRLLWAQKARSGLPARLGERVREGSSFTGCYNRNGARALLHARLGSTPKQELKACSGTSSP